MGFLNRLKFQSAQQAFADVAESVKKNKVTVLEGVASDTDLKQFYETLADRIGPAAAADEDLASGVMTGGRWIEISYDPLIQDRYRTAKVHQPLHTDASYLPHKESVTYFFCKSRASLGGATLFLDSEDLVKAMVVDDKLDLLEQLQQTDVCFSKGGSAVTRPIIVEDSIGISLNYNYYCLDAGNSESVKAMVEEFQAFLEERVMRSGLPTAVTLNPGEAVFFHDYRLLHGRNAYFAKAKGERCLVKGVIKLSGDSA